MGLFDFFRGGARKTEATTPAATPSGGQKTVEVTYTVRDGDTLGKIAKEQLGDAKRYTEIFENNRSVIQDPNKIYPGQVLHIKKAA